jgi:hypothetical protein
MKNLKTPPYGKPLKDLIDSGYKPNNSVYLYSGQQAWERAKQRSISCPERLLILPPYHCPTIYHWPVKQCDILIIDTGFAEVEYIDDLVFCLYTEGASVVRSISPTHELTIFNTHKE